jgi:glucose-6-phosphate 1-epimerase
MISIVLACLACAVHARRMQFTPAATPVQWNSHALTPAHHGHRPDISSISMVDDGVKDEMDGPLRKLTLQNAGGASVTVYTLGASVTSFKAPSEVFFLRPDATFDGSKPIPGGMPHCWPWFGPAESQRHGFARNVEWEVASVSGGASPSVTLTLEPSDYTMGMWPHSFKNTYTVTLGEDNSLTTVFDVANTGSATFNFTTGMHTYFALGDIDATSIKGAFKGSTWRDRLLDQPPPVIEDREALTITSHTDRLYEGVTGRVEIADKANDRTIVVDSQKGWADTVLWSPYGDDSMGYKNFVCMESVKVKDAVVVEAGNTWSSTVRITVE